MTQDLLDPNFLQQNWINVKEDYLNAEDSFFSYGQTTFNIWFFGISTVTKVKTFADKEDPNVLF